MKIKKFLCVFLILSVLLSVFVVSSFADTTTTSSGSIVSPMPVLPGNIGWFTVPEIIAQEGVRRQEDCNFVCNGILFSSVIFGEGIIKYVSDTFTITVYTNGSFIDSGKWNKICAQVGYNITEDGFIRRCIRGYSDMNTDHSLFYGFTDFSRYGLWEYLYPLLEYLDNYAEEPITFYCNGYFNISGMGEDYTNQKFDIVRFTSNRSVEFATRDDSFVYEIDMAETPDSLIWQNIDVSISLSDITSVQLIDYFTLIADCLMVSDFPCFTVEDYTEFHDFVSSYCDIEFEQLYCMGSFYRAVGDLDGSSYPVENSLHFNSNGFLCTSDYVGEFDAFTIISYNGALGCSSAFYWCFNKCSISGFSRQRRPDTSADLVFISSFEPKNFEMFYNYPPPFIDYCGVTINNEYYRYFLYDFRDNSIDFWYDIEEDIDYANPDLSLVADDFKNKAFTISAGSWYGQSFYQFLVSNFILVGSGSIEGDINNAYNQGYTLGFEEGKKIGDNIGYNRGYLSGYNDAKLIYDSDSGGIIHRLLSAPGDAFDGLILYDDGAIVISLWDVFTTLLTASLFVWFLKMFAGG